MKEVVKMPDYIKRNIEKVQEAKVEIVKPEFKNLREIVVVDTLTDQLANAGIEARKSMVQKWEKLNKSERGRKPNKLSPFIVGNILVQHTRFVSFKNNASDDKRMVYMYLGDDMGIYTQSRTTMNRYMRIVEPKITIQNQNEAYNYLGDYVELVNPTVDRYLIPVRNGIFNLKTKQLEPFNSKYVFTSKGNTKYIENPQKPIFTDSWDIDKWLGDIAVGDKEVEEVLWQVINDSINGSYSRGRAVWLIGDGNNGKGTYQDLIRYLVGAENVASLKIDQFNTSKYRFNTSMLEGKTVNIGDDVQAGIYIDNSSDFNSVVTGDTIKVEQKGKGAYNKEFRLTIIQSTNKMPKIKNKTNGTYRRLLIVPFNADFNGQTENKQIKQKYVKNPKFLEYVLHKAINMDFEDFNIPKVSKEMLEGYKAANNPILEFKQEIFDDVMQHQDRVPKQTVFDMYMHFCQQRNYQPTNHSNFKEDFEPMIAGNYEAKQAKYTGDEQAFSSLIPMHANHPKRGQNVQSYLKKIG